MKKTLTTLFLIFLYVTFSIGFCYLPQANAALEATLREQVTSNATTTLFARAGSGDYYTLYPEGIKKEEAFIGGFKSAQLDPQEENIYFFDTTLKVIGRINLRDGKVYKVIGKPKNITITDYSLPVKFSDAALAKLVDFTFDKYGNIFILYTDDTSSNLNPRLLKASLKEGSVKEITNINNQLKKVADSSYLYNIAFALNGISSDQNGLIYLYGTSTVQDRWPYEDRITKSPAILKFNLLSNVVELYGATEKVKSFGFNPKIILNPSTYFSIKGIAFDHDNICYLSTSDYVNSLWRTDTLKVVPGNDSTFIQDTFIGNGTGNPNDIGDGGSAISAYSSLVGSKYLCEDKNEDVYIADNGTNRIRKILKDSGLITTVVGSGTESITFGQSKTPRSISLQSPTSLLVDKSDNLYIVENGRILLVNNLITHADKPTQTVKIADLAITKIAGNEIKNPKGDITLPDLTLDYTYSGDQTVEVKGENIPDGTNIKLLTTSSDGIILPNPPSGKLLAGLATIPVKIEAGLTKIIKAETDLFIPAPGVYLTGTEPKITSNELPLEPQGNTPIRDMVNAIANVIPFSGRFNFANTGWQSYNGNIAKLNSALDPDNISNDATLIDFGTNPNTIWLDRQGLVGKTAIFSVWMRTDSHNVTVPIGIGPSCADSFWNECNYIQYISNNQPSNIPSLSYSTVTVTPIWQQFVVKSNPGLNNVNKALFIGGLNQTTNQKIYAWGTRLEQTQ